MNTLEELLGNFPEELPGNGIANFLGGVVTPLGSLGAHCEHCGRTSWELPPGTSWELLGELPGRELPGRKVPDEELPGRELPRSGNKLVFGMNLQNASSYRACALLRF